MKTNLVKTQIALLLVSGALLILVGTFIIVSPAEFYDSNSIDLGANVNLLNELKAPAGLLLAAGMYMISAIFVHGKTDVALWLAALIYLSYAVSRSASMAFDGVPATGLVMATALEATIGLTCLVVLLISKKPVRKVA
ncbi:MAG: DUF4345 domain-containing protein [Granulosicoccus sp.]|nr:DUF4345 domain-containing protein [Granulosicoccus sp.]